MKSELKGQRRDRRRLVRVWAAMFMFGGWVPAAVALATPGDLDPTFGVGGVVTTDLPGTYYENANAVLRQPDGKLVVTGQDASGYAALTVIRYLPDGSLDPTFGDGGVFVAPVTDLVQIGQKLALQSDGKVIVLGSAIIRITTDGQLDPSFGIGGIVRQLSVGGFYPFFVDLERQADDKLVLFGMIDTPSRLFVLVRLDADGNLDPTFGSGGATITAPPQYADARSLTVQPDGKFVGAGNSLLRYLPDGMPDPSFGVGGIVTGDFFAYDVIADPDGKLTTAGFQLRRFNADGTPDQTFGSGGVAEVDLDRLDLDISYLSLTSVVRQPDGKYVGGGSDHLLVRFTRDGRLDRSFGKGGVVELPPAPLQFLTDVIQQPDQRLVVVGGYGVIGAVRLLDDVCGDGVQQDGEACEDGNLVDGDGCDSNCTPTGCGNGVLTAGEQCDDGNVAGGDCCASTCQLEADVSPCDDGNACTNVDGCVQGACVGGSPTDCADTDACTADVCEPASGLCQHPYQHTAVCLNPLANLEWLALAWEQGNSYGYGEPHFASPLLLAGDHLFAYSRGEISGGNVQVLDRETGALRHVFTKQASPDDYSNLGPIATLGEDLLVVPGDPPSSIERYDGATFELLQTFIDPTPDSAWGWGTGTRLLGIADKVVVFDREEQVVYVFDAASGALLHTLQPLPPEDPDGYARQLLPLGSNLLVGGAGVVHLFELASGELLRSFVDPTPGAGRFGGAIATIAGDVLIGGRREDAVYRFDGATGALVRTFSDPDHVDRTFGQSIVINGNDVVIGRVSGRVHVFDAATGTFRHTILDPNPADDHCFGFALAVFDGNLAVSDPCADPRYDDGDRVGVIYLFDPSGALVGGIQNPAPDSRDGLSAIVAFDHTIVTRTSEDGEGRLYAFRSCVDGTVASGEQCDDGNLISGDGCDNNCTATACGNGITTAGEECDDGDDSDTNACRNDCTPSPCGGECGPCRVCGPDAYCITRPALGCRQSLSPRDSTLMMQTSSDGRAQLSWRWRKGAATIAAALGDPTTTSYTLCVFDESPMLAQSTLVMLANAPAGEACSPQPHRRPCWKKSARGVLSYRDPDRTPIAAIRLKPGADGQAEATVTGAGPRLRLPSLPADLPLRVQLQSSTGQCWEETYSTSSRNDATRFRGHAD